MDNEKSLIFADKLIEESNKNTRPLVLVVEDDTETSQFIVLTLRPDFDIITATNGEDAFEKCLEYKPDLILSDIMMPKMNGEEMVEKIRQLKEFDIMPIVLLTSNADKDLRLKLLQRGAQDCLIKPFSQDELKAKVATLINLKQAKFALLQQKLEMESLAETNRIKNSFLANMSHELRTPLNAITGFSELLHDGKVGEVSDEQREFLKIILSSSRHLLHLINEILDLTKIESGKVSFHHEPIDMSALIQEVKETFYLAALDKNITLVSNIDPKVSTVTLDKEKLKGVFYNYISNAIKFTPNGGKITVNVSPIPNNNFMLEVIDTGIGIKERDLKKLFIEFQQLDTSATKKYQGSGLGLALTKHIVEALNGQVGVKSIYGQGSTFYAILPCFLSPTSASKETQSEKNNN